MIFVQYCILLRKINANYNFLVFKLKKKSTLLKIQFTERKRAWHMKDAYLFLITFSFASCQLNLA